jgi:uncharacterized protein YecT (DUF1311 family)
MKTSVTLIISLLMFAWTWADDVQYTKQYNDCISQAAGITKAMRYCIQEEYVKQDKRLQEAYKKALQSEEINPGARKALVAAQLAWLDFKNKTCNYYNEKDGQIFVVMRDQCHLEMTVSQANRLYNLVAHPPAMQK